MKNHALVSTLSAAELCSYIHFADKGSLLSEPDSEDEGWLKGTEYSSIIIIHN